MSCHLSSSTVADRVNQPTRRVMSKKNKKTFERTAQKTRPIWSFSTRGLPRHLSRLKCGWALTPPFQPYLKSYDSIGGILSAALAVIMNIDSECLPVRKRVVLCCPDFPPLWQVKKATKQSNQGETTTLKFKIENFKLKISWIWFFTLTSFFYQISD